MMDILYLLCKLYCKWYCNCNIVVVCNLTVMLIFVFVFRGFLSWPNKPITPTTESVLSEIQSNPQQLHRGIRQSGIDWELIIMAVGNSFSMPVKAIGYFISCVNGEQSPEKWTHYKGMIAKCTPGGASLWWKWNDVATTYLWSPYQWVRASQWPDSRCSKNQGWNNWFTKQT